MPKFSVDLDSVARTVSKRSYKLADVASKIEKVAFDVVKFKDGNPEELWQIQSADDGDYIVAIYDEDKIVTANIKPSWSVVVKNADIHLFYKSNYLCKIAAIDLGIPVNELPLVSKYLPNKLADNKQLVSSLLKSLDYEICASIVNKYPELS